MKKKLLLVLLTLITFGVSYGQDWRKVSEEKLIGSVKMERANVPNKYQLFSLDFNAFKLQLSQAPLDSQNIESTLLMKFPNQNGEIENFKIYEAPVMEAGLSAKFPDIKTYVGKGIEDPTATIRFSVTLFGLHAMTLSGKTSAIFIDTYTKDLNNYIVYSKSDTSPSRNFKCLVNDVIPAGLSSNGLDHIVDTNKASDGQFRQFRLAIACTIEYAAFHINAAGLSAGTLVQKKAAVLAAMVVTVARVNAIYERDLSIRLNLVATNDQIIFVTSDTFTNDDANALIGESQTQITAIIGSANFDIGHTVSTGGGGLAGPSPCVNNSKANGITGSPAPVGDPYDIDYVAHEMGHQFGANHTFNGDAGNCSGNRNNSTAVEPGSGSTIMAYAGICSPQDVQSNSDAHFHAVSIAEIAARIASTANCAPINPNGNTPPVPNAGGNFTIPKGTAFVLRGSATDVNGDALTYCWEQTNTEISTQPPLSTSTTGPNFRSKLPTVSPNRYFPALSYVVAGNLAPRWEVVPTVARTMNFALTVRDNRTPNGGQTGRANMVLTVGAAGPFNITSQSSNVTWVQNTSELITWNVAGTTASPYNSPNVNILFSSDNGVTFTTLLSNTPNDGTQTITVPNISAPYCKIMIESVGNVFYAVNIGNIAIGYTVNTTTTCNTYSASPNAIIIESSPVAYQDFVINVPTGGVISDVNVSTNITSHRVNQLYLRANHPDNTSVVLLFGDGYGCNNSETSLITTFDDAGVPFTCAGSGTGLTVKSADELNILNGKDAAGNWKFRVKDITVGVDGILNSYSFNICTSVTTVTLGTPSDYEFSDFTLYPNPNNRNFTLKFKSNTSNDINIVIHDLRGRSVFENNYSNSGIINQNIQLDNTILSGVYLASISDGEKKVVKRIIIE